MCPESIRVPTSLVASLYVMWLRLTPLMVASSSLDPDHHSVSIHLLHRITSTRKTVLKTPIDRQQARMYAIYHQGTTARVGFRLFIQTKLVSNYTAAYLLPSAINNPRSLNQPPHPQRMEFDETGGCVVCKPSSRPKVLGVGLFETRPRLSQ
jgi:hypothetical protein